MAQTNLPTDVISGQQTTVKQFFNKFFTHEITFPAAQIDIINGFFLKRGFDDTSSKSITIILLNQARVDNVSVFQLVDSLKKLNEIQLSQVVGQVINAYRENTSLLGYRIAPLVDTYETRNILV
jgi:hypothetical protein